MDSTTAWTETTPEGADALRRSWAANAARRAAALERALVAAQERMNDLPPLPRATDHQPAQPARRAAAERAWSRHHHRTRGRWSAYRRTAHAATWTAPSRASRATGPR